MLCWTPGYVLKSSAEKPFCLSRLAVLWARASGMRGSEVPCPKKTGIPLTFGALTWSNDRTVDAA